MAICRERVNSHFYTCHAGMQSFSIKKMAHKNKYHEIDYEIILN